MSEQNSSGKLFRKQINDNTNQSYIYKQNKQVMGDMNVLLVVANIFLCQEL